MAATASNRIVKVALVGAGGHIGKHIAEALVATGKHQVTAITRPDSKSSLPKGVDAAKVDYADHEALVSALKGHDALIITIAITAQAQQEQLIRAAAEADVPWILPNEWGFDSNSDAMLDAMGLRERSGAPKKLIEQLGKSSWIAVATGFWFEWSLSFPDAFGFDFEKKAVTLFDEGESRTSVSSWPQCGRAVAALLSLPVAAEAEGGPCLEQFKNKWVYPTSAAVSQKEMLASVLRVTGTKEADWTVTKEPAKQRFESAMQDLRAGNGAGFVKAMYARAFFEDEPTNLERWRGGGHNGALGLSKENLDGYTKAGIERVSEMTAWLKAIHGR